MFTNTDLMNKELAYNVITYYQFSQMRKELLDSNYGVCESEEDIEQLEYITNQLISCTNNIRDIKKVKGGRGYNGKTPTDIIRVYVKTNISKFENAWHGIPFF